MGSRSRPYADCVLFEFIVTLPNELGRTIVQAQCEWGQWCERPSEFLFEVVTARCRLCFGDVPSSVVPMIWKFLLLVRVPVGVVTTTGPVVAPSGTTAVM